MSRNRFVQPDVVTLPLSEGDSILVKKRLNRGEETQLQARMYLAGHDGRMTVNPTAVGMSTVLAYLLDWTFTDANGKKVAIAGKSVDDVESILNSLDPDDFREVLTAIERHEEATARERDAQKKILSGPALGGSISSSPSVPAGASTGSAPSTPTTTTSS